MGQYRQEDRGLSLADIATQIATEEGVRPALVLAVMQRESSGRPFAVGPPTPRGSAFGPMQLMAGTARDLNVNRQDPTENLRGGVRYLKQQLQRFGGDERLALAAYNAGPGAVQRAGGLPPFKETQAYVASIVQQAGAPPRVPQHATGGQGQYNPDDLATSSGPPVPSQTGASTLTPPPSSNLLR